MEISEKQALEATYIAGAISAFILLSRLVLSYGSFDASFFITLFALPVVLARTLVRHFSLSYGTASEAIHQLSLNPAYEPDYPRIRVAAGLSISGRILLTTHLWTMCLLLLLLYRRFVWHLAWMPHALKLIYVTMAATWIATTSLNLFECHPFSKYYQVVPDPGICLRAYQQTLVQCVSNIVLDLAIMCISIPILVIQNGNVMLKLRLFFMISLGSVCIIASALRLAYIFKTGSAQPLRDLWAAVTVGASTLVANAPFLYGAIRRKRMLWSQQTYEGDQRHATARTGTLGTSVKASPKIMAQDEEFMVIQKKTSLVVSEEIKRARDSDGDDIELLTRRDSHDNASSSSASRQQP